MLGLEKGGNYGGNLLSGQALEPFCRVFGGIFTDSGSEG